MVTPVHSRSQMVGQTIQNVTFIFSPQDLKPIHPVSVKIITKASGVQLQQKDGPSVTLGNALLKLKVVRLQLSL